MNQIARRIWVAAVLMICGWICTAWVRSGYTFEVRQLAQGLESLPMQLDGYEGADLPVDDEVAKILNADSTVNRKYRRTDGTSLVLHGSAWVRPESVASVAPHSPKVCYTNAGWRITQERGVDVTTSSGTIPLWLLFLEKDGNQCVVAYWYQMGSAAFNNATEARKVHRQLWGQKSWPATVKFMIQVPAQGIDPALPQIKEFALTVHQWAEKL